jgi:hypothetical protein
MSKLFEKSLLQKIGLVSLALLLCSLFQYYPFGFFINNWVYLWCIVGVLYHLVRSEERFFHLAVGALLLVTGVWAAPYLLFLGPWILISSLGFEKITLFENEHYRVMITRQPPMSSGQSDFSVFEKLPVGIKRIYRGATHYRSSATIETRGETPWLILTSPREEESMEICLRDAVLE